MMFITAGIAWIIAHKTEIAALYGLLVAISSIIVKWTPNKKDDEILSKIVDFFNMFSVANKKSDADILRKVKSGAYRLTRTKRKGF